MAGSPWHQSPLTATLNHGAGANNASIGRAGHPPTPISPRTIPTLGTAAFYDPYNRAYVLASDLTVESMPPEMQRVALLLGIRKGALASTPNDGLDIAPLKLATRRNAQKVSENEIRRALKPALDDSDVAIVKITAIVAPRWLGQIFTDVRSLRDPTSKPFRFTTGVQK